MKRYIGLNELPLDAQKVLKNIGEMIDSTASMGDRVIVLEVQPIKESGQVLMPLLEYKENV